MMALFTAALFLLVGLGVAARERDEPFERLTYGAVGGGALWLGSTWILALTHNLTRPALIARFVVLLIVSVVVLRVRKPAFPRLHWALVPIALWVAFILWRGALIPPVSHDALAYHLPKATLLVRSAGYDYFPFLIPAVRTLPINYELLLAEEMIWAGSDQLTEWVSVPFFLFFVIASAALSERWWKSWRAAVAVAVFSAGVPVLLLHSGAHKNDTMVASFMVAALVAAGRWVGETDWRALIVSIVAFACAIGTKPQAGMLAVVIAPFVLWPLFRDLRRGALVVVLSVAAFLGLGGTVYVVNYAHEGSILDSKEQDQRTGELLPYGDWSTLWQGPYVLLAAPFSPDRYSLRVPWEDKPWFWRRYEIYFSDLGIVWALSAALAPFAILWTRRLAPEGSFARGAITLSALVTFAIMLPVGFKPHGLYTISLPRYALFIVPVIFGWTIAPLLVRFQPLFRPALALAVLAFCVNGVLYARNDAFAPAPYLEWAIAHPGTRVIAFDPNRAASIADRRAGPRDVIAVDAGYGTWIQPLFGRDLERPVEWIAQRPGTPRISDQASWVVVDRAYTAVWGHPEFRDLSQARQYLLRGTPRPDEVKVIEHLRRDSRFELVFYNRRMVQAVFRRVR